MHPRGQTSSGSCPPRAVSERLRVLVIEKPCPLCPRLRASEAGGCWWAREGGVLECISPLHSWLYTMRTRVGGVCMWEEQNAEMRS